MSSTPEIPSTGVYQGLTKVERGEVNSGLTERACAFLILSLLPHTTRFADRVLGESLERSDAFPIKAAMKMFPVLTVEIGVRGLAPAILTYAVTGNPLLGVAGGLAISPSIRLFNRAMDRIAQGPQPKHKA